MEEEWGKFRIALRTLSGEMNVRLIIRISTKQLLLAVVASECLERVQFVLLKVFPSGTKTSFDNRITIISTPPTIINWTVMCHTGEKAFSFKPNKSENMYCCFDVWRHQFILSIETRKSSVKREPAHIVHCRFTAVTTLIKFYKTAFFNGVYSVYPFYCLVRWNSICMQIYKRDERDEKISAWILRQADNKDNMTITIFPWQKFQ